MDHFGQPTRSRHDCKSQRAGSTGPHEKEACPLFDVAVTAVSMIATWIAGSISRSTLIARWSQSRERGRS